MADDSRSDIKLEDVGVRPNALLAPITVIQDVVENRFLVRNLIRREVRGRYRNAMLGYGWTIIEPALLAAVYWFLFIMLSGNPDRMYAVWVLVGVIVWSCFGKALTASTNSLAGNARTMKIVYFPRSIFPITAVGANVVITLMSCLIILPIIYLYEIDLTINLIFIPLGILMAGILALSIGMMVAPLNCIQGDVSHFMRFVTRAGFFLSPVMWTAEMALEKGSWGAAALWNPVSVPITMVRHGLEGKALDLPSEYIISSIILTILFWIIGSMVFCKFERGSVKHL